MNNPTDDVLLRFIAEFVGYRNIQDRGHRNPLRLCAWIDPICMRLIPDYLNNLEEFQGDVFPRMTQQQIDDVVWELQKTNYLRSVVWATAKERCLALWRACEGKVP